MPESPLETDETVRRVAALPGLGLATVDGLVERRARKRDLDHRFVRSVGWRELVEVSSIDMKITVGERRCPMKTIKCRR